MELFVYGTLMVPEVMRTVCGHARDGQPALLHDYRRRRVIGEWYPAIIPHVGDAVGGILYCGLTDRQFRALDAFEGEMYRREMVTVAVGTAAVRAYAYVLVPTLFRRLSEEPWILEDFLAVGLGHFLNGYHGFASSSAGKAQDDAD